MVRVCILYYLYLPKAPDAFCSWLNLSSIASVRDNAATSDIAFANSLFCMSVLFIAAKLPVVSPTEIHNNITVAYM